MYFHGLWYLHVQSWQTDPEQFIAVQCIFWGILLVVRPYPFTKSVQEESL